MNIESFYLTEKEQIALTEFLTKHKNLIAFGASWSLLFSQNSGIGIAKRVSIETGDVEVGQDITDYSAW